MVKNTSANAGDAGSIPWLGRSPGGEMATHSSILAWTIPWTEEPGKLQSIGHKELDTTEATEHSPVSVLYIYTQKQLVSRVTL